MNVILVDLCHCLSSGAKFVQLLGVTDFVAPELRSHQHNLSQQLQHCDSQPSHLTNTWVLDLHSIYFSLRRIKTKDLCDTSLASNVVLQMLARLLNSCSNG